MKEWRRTKVVEVDTLNTLRFFIMTRDIKFLHAFNTIPGIGPATLRALKKYFSSFEIAWNADEEELKKAIPKERFELISWRRPGIHPDKEMERLIHENVWIMTDDQRDFPSLLREISQPPIILYGKGNVLSKIFLGVVGTRRPTSYGIEAAENITAECVTYGIGIVSGLAVGIDAHAHHSALEHQGYTVGVLGSGVDNASLFPPENQNLAKKIVDSGGAIISEYAPGTPAVKEHFPQRNRIISGLSRAVVVVEARERSGALITARFALEQGRDVFAVPGSIFSPTSAGPNALIRDGAMLASSARDVLQELGIDLEEKNLNNFVDLTPEEKIILMLLEEPLTVDFLKTKSNLSVPNIIATLSMLELKGKIRRMGDEQYQKA